MKTKYHIIEKLESDVTVTELAEIHGTGKATIADRIKIHIKKQKDDIDHYPKPRGFLGKCNSGRTFEIYRRNIPMK